MSKRSSRGKKAGATGVLSSPIPVAESVSPVRRWHTRDWLYGLILGLAVALVYQPVWHAGFVWDDDVHLTANPAIVGPLGFKDIWTITGADVSPLTRSTFWLEHALWGLSPLPYHLVNVLLHAACAIVLWKVLVKLRVPYAWFGAALWALHPVMVESVAWVTEMKNTESGLFFLLSILFFIGEVKTRGLAAHDGGGWRRHSNYAFTLLFAAFAIACKSTTAILPVTLCLCAWWLDGRWQWRNLTTAIPVTLMSIAASVVSIQSSTLSLATWIAATPGAAISNTRWLRSWPQRLISAGDAAWFYLGKLLWPHPLMAIYPRWKIDAGEWFLYLPLLAMIVVLSVLWAKRQSWARPYFFALAWFLIALLPLLGIFDNYIFHYTLVFDHFQYLASMAPLALAAVGMVRLSDFAIPGQLRMKTVAGAAVLLLLGLLSWQRAWAYESQETLWADATAKNPECWLCYSGLGNALLEKGQVDDAILQFQKAVEINPDRAEDQSNLGVALVRSGRPDEAVEHYNAALKINPNDAKAQYGLGYAFLRKGRPDDAAAHFRKGLEIEPGHAEGHNAFGMALVQEGHTAEAMEKFSEALRIDPGFAEAHYNLGDALAQAGRTDEAIVHLQAALEINPNYAEAHNDLGISFAQKGRLSEAITQFQSALHLNPNYQSAQENLARAEAAR